MLATPVIFVVFNRPEVTARVFARIRNARPAHLYIICDGPRAHKPEDAVKVAAVRALIDQGIDWPCTVHRDYVANNLGCRQRVASGLNNAFGLFEEAIILEDDCLPDPSFFPYCAELLERYRDDPDVLHISGTNLAGASKPHGASYRFSHHPWIWGWATWRRVWKQYDFEMKTWEERLPRLRASFASSWEAQYWISTYNGARADLAKTNTWGFPWMYSCRSLGGLTILPTVNLVENLGIGVDSTHTKEDAAHLQISAQSLKAPLSHPENRKVDQFKDEHFTRNYCGKTGMLDALKSKIRTWRAHQSPSE